MLWCGKPQAAQVVAGECNGMGRYRQAEPHNQNYVGRRQKRAAENQAGTNAGQGRKRRKRAGRREGRIAEEGEEGGAR